MKILEAMAAGGLVVSTTLGAEGPVVSPDVDILIADKDEDWLTRLAVLSRQSDSWNGLAIAGRELVRSRYDWEVSSPGESHAEALAGPYVNVSAHTAPATEPRRTPIRQCAHNFGSPLEIRATQCVALRK